MGDLSLALPRRVVIAHNPAGPEDDPSTSDVLAQVGLVARGLAELGIPAEVVAVPAGRPWEVLTAAPGLLVFNLIESPPGAPHLGLAATAALEAMEVPFTGSPAAALWLTTDKLATRAVLAAAGLPVAPGGRLDPGCPEPEVLDRVAPPWIVKPACEDASVGIEESAVCTDRGAALARAAALERRFPGQPVLVERFLTGREFNVSVLDGEDGPEVLPIAEMLFVDFPPEMPRVLGYEAKWQEDSFVYEHTVRRYAEKPENPENPESPEDTEDAPLLARLRELALATWRVCGLAGYGRIDMRLDESGEPFVLEANANPCIAPDAGMVAAAAQAGIGPRELVERIIRSAMRRNEAARGRTAAQAGGTEEQAGATGTTETGRAGTASQENGGAGVAETGDPGTGGAVAATSGLSGASAVSAVGPIEDASEAARGAAHLAVRDGLETADGAAIERLLRATGFFNEEEVEVAMELVGARLAEGPGCHYRFLVGELDGGDGGVAGYACWGPIPGTRASADLYWIAVDPRHQKRGAGAGLLAASEERMAAEGIQRVYVETSTRPQYEPTRRFYLGNGYQLAAELPGFYAPGDGKAIFLKVLGG